VEKLYNAPPTLASLAALVPQDHVLEMVTQQTMMLMVAVAVAVMAVMVPMPMEMPAAHAAAVDQEVAVAVAAAAQVEAVDQEVAAQVEAAQVEAAQVEAAQAVVLISLRMLIADLIKAPDSYICTSMDSKYLPRSILSYESSIVII